MKHLEFLKYFVRDQGVGGSNPLSPTNFFNGLQSINTHEVLNLVEFEGFCSYKIVYRASLGARLTSPTH
jgi:hypothetical protein